MSGGSMDYCCWKVEEIADMELDYEIADLLNDLANYLHDEEWYRSGSRVTAASAFAVTWTRALASCAMS